MKGIGDFMVIFLKLLIASAGATLVMTLFSYLLAGIKNSEFEEPQLLNKLLKRGKTLKLDISKKSFIGWLIHFFIGLVMVLILYGCWQIFNIEPTVLSGLLLGIGLGILGILGWKMLFALNSNPPDVHLSKFFIQLLVAHCIFSIIATLIFNFLYKEN